MVIKTVKRFLLAIVLLVVLAPLCAASAPGFGARAIGMGGAYTAVADDGSAAYWNPAGITQVKVGLALDGGLEGSLQQMEALQKQDPAALDNALGLKAGASLTLSNFGLHYVTDQRAAIESGAVPKTMRIDQTNQVAFTIAHELTDLFAFGLNAKYVTVSTEKFTETGQIAQADGKGVAVDLGAMFKVGKLVRLGAVLKDFGLTKLERSGEDEWPTQLVLGGAVKVPLFGTVVAADLATPLSQDQDPTFHLGVEQPLLGIFALRAGGYHDSAGLNLTTGCGLKLGPVAFDVAANLDAAKVTTVYATAQLKF
ncbi:MAG TPA: hypothetical protein GXX33_01735 [Firmicutes bacterium]|uniref:DUF5723 domain-containing protein n=1 Tax=Capillibacterium thermochitinicola TaxID=2699427 RepID=A0A8J6LM25_9FIRM|nr:hypothetical protein [Capillibacterium thermochitinicola]HHW11717.1 hypothetical protein [Bacillota bacterium]